MCIGVLIIDTADGCRNMAGHSNSSLQSFSPSV